MELVQGEAASLLKISEYLEYLGGGMSCTGWDLGGKGRIPTLPFRRYVSCRLYLSLGFLEKPSQAMKDHRMEWRKDSRPVFTLNKYSHRPIFISFLEFYFF